MTSPALSDAARCCPGRGGCARARSSPPAKQVMDTIIDTYLQPRRTLRQRHALAKQGGIDLRTDFAEACRRERVDSLRCR
jgi:hypothetical protein